MNADINSFLSILGDLDEKLAHSTFNYVSAHINGRQHLLQGRVFFNAFPSNQKFTSFSHGIVRVEQIPFRSLNLKTKDAIENILSGYIPVNDGIIFKSGNIGYGINYQPLHPAGGRVNRLSVLSIEGAEILSIASQEILDWEVRGAEKPYDNINELLNENRLGLGSKNVIFEFVLNHVAEIDHSSRVYGDIAKIGIFMPHDLPRELSSIGYRVMEKQNVVERSRIEGSAMTWTESENHVVGSAEVPVPRSAIVHCVANFMGVAQYSYYITDPENAPNDRRTTYETFDLKRLAV